MKPGTHEEWSKDPEQQKLLEVRCIDCRRFAYGDLFSGEWDEAYRCSGCVKLLNERLFGNKPGA